MRTYRSGDRRTIPIASVIVLPCLRHSFPYDMRFLYPEVPCLLPIFARTAVRQVCGLLRSFPCCVSYVKRVFRPASEHDGMHALPVAPVFPDLNPAGEVQSKAITVSNRFTIVIHAVLGDAVRRSRGMQLTRFMKKLNTRPTL